MIREDYTHNATKKSACDHLADDEEFVRRLEEAYPYVLLDARYEKVREEGSVRSRAVQIALWMDGAGRRQVLAAEVANREARGRGRNSCRI